MKQACNVENNDSLFNYIHVIHQYFEIIPDDHEHYGAHIEYQDIDELRTDFLNELEDSIINWVYSGEKYDKLVEELTKNGKTFRATSSEIIRRAHSKFRGSRDSDKLCIQGQLGELLLFNFICKYMKANPLLRKMSITTSTQLERFGADAIHYKKSGDKNIIILGEAKTYTSKYQFTAAFSDALESILSTYKNIRNEMRQYVHEDFLSDELNIIAEKYLNHTLPNTEVHLVSIIIYDETQKLKVTDEADIKEQIKSIIEEKYRGFDNEKIDIEKNPILKRITYIVFPIWRLDELAREFQNRI